MQWKWQATSASRRPFSPVVPETALYSMTVSSLSSQSRVTTSPHTRRKLQKAQAVQRCTCSPLAKRKKPAGLAARLSGHIHLGSPTQQAPASPPISLITHPPQRNKGISVTMRSVYPRQKNRKTYMTTRTVISPPSPRSHPMVRKTASKAPTWRAATPPVKASVALLHILPPLSTTRKSVWTAPPAPQLHS